MGFANQQAFGADAPFTLKLIADATSDLGTVGDSRIAQHFTGTAPNIIREHRGIAYWLGLLTDGAVQVQQAFAGGVGGDTTQMCFVRTPALSALKSGTVLSRFGTNDPTSSTYTASWTVDMAIAASIEYMTAIITNFLDNGHPVVHVSQTPRGGVDGPDKELTGDKLKHFLGILNWELNVLPTLRLGRYQRSVDGVGNAWKLWLDPASTPDRPLPLPGLTVDGLHDTHTGAFLATLSVLPFYKRRYATKAHLPNTPARSLAYSSLAATPVPLGVLTRNPTMLGTAGNIPASVNALPGSVLPDTWNAVAASFTGVKTKFDIVDTPAGKGIKVTFSGNATTAGAYLSIEPAAVVALADVVAGDKLEAIGWMKAEGKLSACLQAAPEIRFVRGGTTSYVRDGNKYTTVVCPLLMDAFVGSGVSGVTRTPTLAVDKTETEIKQRFTIYLQNGVDLNFSVTIAAHGTRKIYS